MGRVTNSWVDGLRSWYTKLCFCTGEYGAGINEGTSDSMAMARKESVVEGAGD